MSLVVAGFLSLLILLCQGKKLNNSLQNLQYNKSRNLKYVGILALVYILNVSLTIYLYNGIHNPAFGNLIINTNVILILLYSLLFFKVKISTMGIIGFILTFMGLSLIILGKWKKSMSIVIDIRIKWKTTLGFYSLLVWP